LDYCPGVVVTLDGTKDVTLPGDLTRMGADYVGEAACATATGPEVVYNLTPSVGGHLTAKVDGAFDSILYARVDACSKGRQVACAPSVGPGAGSLAAFDVVGGWQYFLFADSASKSSGPFTLALHLVPGPVCGDGHVDPGEACDDGNDIDGDGCDHTCNPDGNVAAYGHCPGQPIDVWSTVVRYVGRTSMYPDSFVGSCGGAGSADRVFQVTPHQAGKLYATVFNASFDVVVYARTGSCAGGTEVGCSNANGAPADGGTASEELVINGVVAGQTYWVVVDGVGGPGGDFALDLGVY
jgi:cysteine-rich repeat protein